MQSGFRAHRRVSSPSSPLSLSLLSKRQKNLCCLRRPLRMDRRRSRALFCVFPFCREARFSLLHITTIRHKASFFYRGHDAQGLSFVSPDFVSLYPAPFSPVTLYLHPSRRFFKASSSHRLIPSSGPIFLSLSPSPSLTLPCCILFIRVIVLRVYIPGEL